MVTKLSKLILIAGLLTSCAEDKMGKPKRVVVIDTQNAQVYEHVVYELSDMQKIVGGLIERATILPNGDEVYVNEEGLFDNSLRVFLIRGGHQPFKGNAYVIGPVTATGNNKGALSTVQEIQNSVVFL